MGVLAAKFLGYNSSKAALNMLTVQLAAELRNAGIKVNSADPGFNSYRFECALWSSDDTRGSSSGCAVGTSPE